MILAEVILWEAATREVQMQSTLATATLSRWFFFCQLCWWPCSPRTTSTTWSPTTPWSGNPARGGRASSPTTTLTEPWLGRRPTRFPCEVTPCCGRQVTKQIMCKDYLDQHITNFVSRHTDAQLARQLQRHWACRKGTCWTKKDLQRIPISNWIRSLSHFTWQFKKLRSCRWRRGSTTPSPTSTAPSPGGTSTTRWPTARFCSPTPTIRISGASNYQVEIFIVYIQGQDVQVGSSEGPQLAAVRERLRHHIQPWEAGLRIWSRIICGAGKQGCWVRGSDPRSSGPGSAYPWHWRPGAHEQGRTGRNFAQLSS